MKVLWTIYGVLVALIVAVAVLGIYTADNVNSQGMFMAVSLFLGLPVIGALTVIFLVISWAIRKREKR